MEPGSWDPAWEMDPASSEGGPDEWVPAKQSFPAKDFQKRSEGHAYRARRNRMDDPPLKNGPDKQVFPNMWT